MPQISLQCSRYHFKPMDREAFGQAIKQKDSVKIRELLQRDDAKELLVMKRENGWLPIHDACYNNLDSESLQRILDVAVEHGIIKKMLEENKHYYGWTCLHFACAIGLSTDSFRLLLEYLLKHADIKKMLEEKNDSGSTCLHFACTNRFATDSLRLLLECMSKHADITHILEAKAINGQTCFHRACENNMSADCFRLLISFFPSDEFFQLFLGTKDSMKKTALDLTQNDEHKELLQDPNCWRECRYWLLCNHQETFLNSLYPNSPEKTLEALKELNKNYSDDETLKKATVDQQNFVERLRVVHDESAERQVLELTALSTTEDFHRDHIIQLENAEVRQFIADFQRQKPLSEEERDRQELEKLIFDRSSRDRCIAQVIPILHDNDVTKESFFLLKESDFRDMKIKIGPMRQLLQIIEQEIFRRNNLSARSDISSRPRSPGHTPRILGVVPPIALSASAVVQQHQQQTKLSDDAMSFAATETEVSENGGSSKPQTNSTGESF